MGSHMSQQVRSIQETKQKLTIVAWNRFLTSLRRCVSSFMRFGLTNQKLDQFVFWFFWLILLFIVLEVWPPEREVWPLGQSVWPPLWEVWLLGKILDPISWEVRPPETLWFEFLLVLFRGFDWIQYKSSAMLDWLIFIAFIAIGVRVVLNLI